MSQAFRFQYDYSSAAASAYEAHAIGDLDCDGIAVAYTMTGDASTGSPTSTLVRPARAD